MHTKNGPVGLIQNLSNGHLHVNWGTQKTQTSKSIVEIVRIWYVYFFSILNHVVCYLIRLHHYFLNYWVQRKAPGLLGRVCQWEPVSYTWKPGIYEFRLWKKKKNLDCVHIKMKMRNATCRPGTTKSSRFWFSLPHRIILTSFLFFLGFFFFFDTSTTLFYLSSISQHNFKCSVQQFINCV